MPHLGHDVYLHSFIVPLSCDKHGTQFKVYAKTMILTSVAIEVHHCFSMIISTLQRVWCYAELHLHEALMDLDLHASDFIGKVPFEKIYHGDPMQINEVF